MATGCGALIERTSPSRWIIFGKTENQAIQHLRKEANPFIGIPEGPTDVEVMVDVYYPNTIDDLDDEIRGRAVHPWVEID